MNMNVKKFRSVVILLALVMMLSVVMTACVNTENVPEIMDTSFVENESVDIGDDSEEVDLTPDAGQSEAPVVSNVVHIAPTTVAVSGTCEVGATVRVTTTDATFETLSRDGYYVIEVELPNKANKLLVTAQAEGETESKAREEIVSIDATADTRLDGNSVSVGVNSLLYFDKMAVDANGDNLYTESQLNAIQTQVSDNITAYVSRSNGKDVEMIYVLLPNATTLDPTVFPEGTVEKPATTVYDQVLNTLNKTRATVIDMRAIFRTEIIQGTANGPLFRVTDSALTDYGAYLTYQQIMNVVDDRFADAAARGIDEFEWKTVRALGGNLVGYRELDKNVITEEIKVATPKFSLDLGIDTSTSPTISSLVKFLDKEENDYNYSTAINGNDGINSISERWVIDTNRENLPDAIIYRDYGALSFTDLLLERFDRTLIGASGDLTFDAAIVQQYYPDYIIVVISEDNMDTAFGISK